MKIESLRINDPVLAPRLDGNTRVNSSGKTSGRTSINTPGRTSGKSTIDLSRNASRESSNGFRWGLLLAIGILLAGCTSTSSPNFTDSGLVRTASSRGELFVKPDHNIGAYDQTLIAPIIVSHQSERKGLHPRESARLAANLDRNLRARAENGGIQVATMPGPCAITLAFSIKDIEVAQLMSDIEGGSNSTFIRSMGAVTLEVDIRDSLTDTALLRFSERRKLDGGQIPGTGRAALLNGLGKTLGVLLADFAERLQEVIPRTSKVSSLSPTCKGRIRQAVDAGTEPP